MLVERNDIWEIFVTRKLFHMILLTEFEIKDFLIIQVECHLIHCFINKLSCHSNRAPRVWLLRPTWHRFPGIVPGISKYWQILCKKRFESGPEKKFDFSKYLVKKDFEENGFHTWKSLKINFSQKIPGIKEFYQVYLE